RDAPRPGGVDLAARVAVALHPERAVAAVRVRAVDDADPVVRQPAAVVPARLVLRLEDHDQEERSVGGARVAQLLEERLRHAAAVGDARPPAGLGAAPLAEAP